MKDKKGFIFTMDAVFALVIATIAASMLLYIHFLPSSSYQSPINEVRGFVNTFTQSNLKNSELLYPPYVSTTPSNPKGITPTGYAVFNGKTSQIQINGVGYSGNPVIVSEWIYPKGTSTLISINALWTLEVSSTGGLDFYSMDGIGNVNTISGLIPRSRWSFITLSISGYVNPTIILYINGVKEVTTTLTGNLAINKPYQIGAATTQPYHWFGYMSNVQIYDTILSSGQIQLLYNNGISGIPIMSSNVLIWLPLANTNTDHSPQRYATTPTDITFSNSLYTAIGNYSINNNESLLGALASMYLNGQAATADTFINNLNMSGNDAIFINDNYAPGLKVANFNGVNSVVTVDKSPSLSINQKFTISFWMYKNIYASTCESVIGKPSSAQLLIYSSTVNGCSPGSESNTGLEFKYTDHLGTIHQLGFNKNIPADVWVQIAAVFNGDILKLYVNGNLTATYSNLIFPNINSNPLYIGQGDSHFNGSIANVQLYRTFLRNSSIKKIYMGGLAGQPVNYSTLAGWWPLLGNSNDYSGNGNSGYGTNVKYIKSNYTPKSILDAYQVSTSSIPLISTDEQGISKLYNVSVVVWN